MSEVLLFFLSGYRARGDFVMGRCWEGLGMGSRELHPNV